MLSAGWISPTTSGYPQASWGWGEANLSIDRKLSSATADATLQMSTCTVDRRSNYKCQESTLPVSVTWNGVGDLVRSSGSWHTVSKGYTYNSHFSGTHRDATAQVSGLEAGTFTWASIYNSRSMDVSASHGAW